MNNNRENILFFRLLKGFTKTVMQQMNNEKFMPWKMSHLTNIFKCRNVLCEEGKTDSYIMWYIEKVCHNKVFLRNLITSHIWQLHQWKCIIWVIRYVLHILIQWCPTHRRTNVRQTSKHATGRQQSQISTTDSSDIDYCWYRFHLNFTNSIYPYIRVKKPARPWCYRCLTN